MRTTRRTFIQSAVAGAACLTLPLVGKAQGNMTTIRYGGSAWLGHYPAWLAIEQGYFKDEGLNVVWESFGTTSARLHSHHPIIRSSGSDNR